MKVLLCDFHREQAWIRWLRDSKNGCTDIKDDVLPYLRSLVFSLTKEEFKSRLEVLVSQPWWERKRLRKYIKNTWLKVKKASTDDKKDFLFHCWGYVI